MEALGESLQSIGESMQALGLRLLTFSFVAYCFVRWLEYHCRWGPTRVIKALWYTALGLAYLVGGAAAGTLAVHICFIEACDLIFEQLESRRETRERGTWEGTR